MEGFLSTEERHASRKVTTNKELVSIEELHSTHTLTKTEPSVQEPVQTPDRWLNSIMNATHSQTSSTPKIHKVPPMLRETKDFNKYYVPRVVSLGPYHYGNPKLQLIQNLKPTIANKLLEENKDRLKCLYNKLSSMAQKLRDYYEENTTDQFSDETFTKMLLLDGCFILYFIVFIDGYENKDNCLGLKSHQIVLVQQDLFLLENQIPYLVLQQIMKDESWKPKIHQFITGRIMAPNDRSDHVVDKEQQQQQQQNAMNGHLLKLLQNRLSDGGKSVIQNDRSYTFRNVHELLAVGISFKPSKTRSLAAIEFRPYGFCANLEIPAIIVDDSTKPMLLNLVAYEMCSDDLNESWVTSYICFLDSLIDHSDDVKELRKAGVIDNCLGSDEEVAQLFNEIGTDLVPNPYAYGNVKTSIQSHYVNKGNSWVNQLKHEYIKTPWAFIALLGGVLGLVFSAVQAYYSIWDPPGDCDHLCKYIRKSHTL